MAGVSSLILACGLAAQVDLLAAIVRRESGGNPLALAVNGAVELVRPPRDRDDAVAMARWLAGHGYNFDAGLAQVNSANLARLGLDTTTVFQPCANLRAAAVVLDECRERARARGLHGGAAVAAALSCYNTGHLSRGVRNGYVAAVHAVIQPAPARAPAARRASAVTLAPFPTASRRAEAFALASAEAFDAPAGLRRAPPFPNSPNPGGER